MAWHTMPSRLEHDDVLINDQKSMDRAALLDDRHFVDKTFDLNWFSLITRSTVFEGFSKRLFQKDECLGAGSHEGDRKRIGERKQIGKSRTQRCARKLDGAARISVASFGGCDDLIEVGSGSSMRWSAGAWPIARWLIA